MTSFKYKYKEKAKKGIKFMLKKVLNLMLTLSIIAGMSVPAMAVSWTDVGRGMYIDSDSIKPGNTYGTDTFDSKAQATNAPFETINGRKIWMVQGNLYVDCRSGYLKERSYKAYDANNNVVISKKNSVKEWFNINANNKPYGLYAYVCGEPYQRYRAGRYYPSWWY